MPQGGFDPISEGATAVADFDPKTEAATAVGGFDPTKEGAKLVASAAPAPVVPAAKKSLWLSPEERTGSHYEAVPEQPKKPVEPSIGSRGGVLDTIDDAIGDVRYGTGSTMLGRLLQKMGAPGIDMGVPESVGETIGGPVVGPLRAIHGAGSVVAADNPDKAIRGANEAIGGVMQAAAPIVAATQPEFLPMATKWMLVQKGVNKVAEKIGLSPDAAELAGNLTMLAAGVPDLVKGRGGKADETIRPEVSPEPVTEPAPGAATAEKVADGFDPVAEGAKPITLNTKGEVVDSTKTGTGAGQPASVEANTPAAAESVTPGPGAQNLGTGVDEGRVDLKQIGMSMRATQPSVVNRIKSAIGDAKNTVVDIVDQLAKGELPQTSTPDKTPVPAFDRVKAVGSAIWDAYRQPEQWTDFKDARGKWDYALQRSSHEAMQFAKDIKSGVPDKVTREAFVNYIQAGGDDAVLKHRSESSSGDLAKGYEAARNLTSTQRIQAENISSWFKQKLEDAQRDGMLSAGIENYVNQVWEKPNPVGQKLQADVDYGTLNTNPSLLKKRIFDSYFEGEKAGFVPRNKDIGFLVTAYDEAFNKAVAGRAMVKSVLSGKAKDGRPLLVANGDRATTIKAPDGGVSANLISPKFIGDKYGDYQPIDHPALRKWTWIGKDSDGKPIYQNGDLWVHPEAYKELRNNLSNSALRQIPVVRTAMDVGQKIKGSMLGYSLFHQVQEGVHAIGHGVNPFRVGKILDFDAPKQKTLIEHGLQVSNARAQSEFMDGHHEAYAYRIPGIGPAAQKYGEYLFNDYIPNLKMKTGLDILARNTKRYAGKYTPDQIAEISAKQANAAYGELNYRQMGRNKTMQDTFRLLALAPDFLEARGRFVAQALRPEGAEQRIALIRLTAVLYGTARVMNMALNSGNPRTDKPFSVTYKGKDYFLRSIPGDIAHLVGDPRSFFYTRLNPTTTKPLIEELTGRDEFGRQRSTGQHFWDTLKGWTPIAVQKWIKNPEDFSPLDSILQGVGVASTKATPSDTKLRKDFTSGVLPLQKLQQMQDRGDVSKEQVQKITAPVRKKTVTKGKK